MLKQRYLKKKNFAQVRISDLKMPPFSRLDSTLKLIWKHLLDRTHRYYTNPRRNDDPT